MLLGIALVVCGALVTVLVVLRLSGRVGVLVLARDVPAGQVLSASDLRTAAVTGGEELAVVPAAEAATVVGRTATLPLHRGRLLAPDDVGPLAWPPVGQAVVAVAVRPGTYPPDLAAGMQVMVGTAPTAAVTRPSGGATAVADALFGAPSGVVLTVRTDATVQGQGVVALLLPVSAAGQVAAISADQLRLVAVPPPLAAANSNAATAPSAGAAPAGSPADPGGPAATDGSGTSRGGG